MAAPETKRRATKAACVPGLGDYFTDGELLVEILGKVRKGYRALDVRVPFEEADDQPMIVLSPSDVNGGKWRRVASAETS